MSKFVEVLLKILTLGIYGIGKTRRVVKRYDKEGNLRVDKDIYREYDFDVEPKNDVNDESTL